MEIVVLQQRSQWGFVCLFNYIFFFMFSDFHVHKVWSPEYVVRNRKSCFILFQARFWCGIRRSSTFFFFSKISHFSFSKFQHGQLNWRYIKTTLCSLVFFYFCGCVLNKPLQTFISLSCSVVVVVVIIEVVLHSFQMARIFFKKM